MKFSGTPVRLHRSGAASLVLATVLALAPASAMAADTVPAVPVSRVASSLTTSGVSTSSAVQAVTGGVVIASSAGYGAPQYPSAKYSMLGHKEAWLAVGGSLSGFDPKTNLAVQYRLVQKSSLTAGIKEAEWSRPLVIYTTNRTLPRPRSVGVFIEGTVRAANFWKTVYPSIDSKRAAAVGIKAGTRVASDIYQWTYMLDGYRHALTTYRVKSALMIGECYRPKSSSASWTAVKSCSLKLAKAQAQKAAALVANAPLQATMPAIPSQVTSDLATCPGLPCVASFQLKPWSPWSTISKASSSAPFALSVTSDGWVSMAFETLPAAESTNFKLVVGTKYSYSDRRYVDNVVNVPSLLALDLYVDRASTVYDSGAAQPVCKRSITPVIGTLGWCDMVIPVTGWGFTDVEVTDGALGTAQWDSDLGAIRYTPPGDDLTDSFSYRLKDGLGGTSPWRTVYLTIDDNPNYS